MKIGLPQEPVLKGPPKFDGTPFMVTTDGSKHGVAGMLSQWHITVDADGKETQRLHPVGFASKRTSASEYPLHVRGLVSLCSLVYSRFFPALRAVAASMGAASCFEESAATALAFSLPGVHTHHNHYATYASASSLPGVHAHQGHAYAYVNPYRPTSVYRNILNRERAVAQPSAGPSSVRTTSGPFSPFVSSGIDVLFTSQDPLQNVITGNLYCVYSHLELHGITSHGLSSVEARQALIYHCYLVCALRWMAGNDAVEFNSVVVKIGGFFLVGV